MIALASAGITRKRQRQLAKILPALVGDLGSAFQQRFTDFARSNPPAHGGALADALAFGRAVAMERPLSKTARIELMVLRSSVKLRRGKVQPRHAPYVAVSFAARPAAAILVARLPLLGVRVLST